MSTSTEERETFELIVNGEAQALPPGSTVADLLRRMDRDPEGAQGLAVAVNERIVRRQDWADTQLEAGDEVEVITALQGG